MRSRIDRCLAGLAAALALICGTTFASAQEQPAAMETSARPTKTEIAQALEAVKADPNLAAETTIKTLQWNQTAPASTETPSWLRWIAGLFGWIDQSARVLVWVAAIGLAVMLIAYLVRFTGEMAAEAGGPISIAPTHVRDLDIRPESLPSDIGAAARALWDRGDHRAALSLLYRGLLSRLAHVHRVPIRDSSTEGDCLTLAESHLSEPRREYASQLVRVWQRAVYGREAVDAAAVYLLCDGFRSALDADVRREAPAQKGAA